MDCLGREDNSTNIMINGCEGASMKDKLEIVLRENVISIKLNDSTVNTFDNASTKIMLRIDKPNEGLYRQKTAEISRFIENTPSER